MASIDKNNERVYRCEYHTPSRNLTRTLLTIDKVSKHEPEATLQLIKHIKSTTESKYIIGVQYQRISTLKFSDVQFVVTGKRHIYDDDIKQTEDSQLCAMWELLEEMGLEKSNPQQINSLGEAFSFFSVDCNNDISSVRTLPAERQGHDPPKEQIKHKVMVVVHGSLDCVTQLAQTFVDPCEEKYDFRIGAYFLVPIDRAIRLLETKLSEPKQSDPIQSDPKRGKYIEPKNGRNRNYSENWRHPK